MRLWPRSEQRTLTVIPSTSPYYVALSDSTITASSAPTNPDVYAAVRVLTDAAASCPLITYRRSTDNERKRASGRTAELLQAPAEGTTQASWVSTVLAHLLLWGNSYIGKFRDEEGRIEQLLPIDPSQVSVERRKGQIVFTITIEGRTQEATLDDVVHVKALSTDGIVGFAPITAMRATLELNQATRVASTGLFQNNGRPSGILSMGHSASVEQAETLKAQWMDKHGGTAAGGIAVISGEIQFLPVAMPADDAEFVAARKLSATEVCRVFRVPPWMLGCEGGDSMTYSNTESQALAFVTFSLRPWLTAIEQALTADRDLFGPSLFCEFLIDGLLRADSKTRSEIYAKALDPITGWMRRDEVRRLENLEPEPEPESMQIPVPSQNGEGVIA